MIGRLATKLGLDAIYVLIDRVDETEETAANQEAAYRLISPLMHELRLLEQYPFAYKFFLPDYILPFYRADGGRSDRIRIYEASWTNNELDEMMQKRLAAYSQQRVESLPYLISPGESSGPLIRLSLLFAHRSPRDLIRIWGRVVDEQLRIDASATAISADAVFSGIDTFCFERTQEIATAGVIRDLRRVAKVDFTVSEVASDVFHVARNAARARIQGWDNRGIVKQIGEVPAPRGRPHHLYGIVDIRVARAALPDIRLDQFVAAKARICPNCDSWVLRDFDDFTGERDETCVECGIPLVAL